MNNDYISKYLIELNEYKIKIKIKVKEKCLLFSKRCGSYVSGIDYSYSFDYYNEYIIITCNYDEKKIKCLLGNLLKITNNEFKKKIIINTSKHKEIISKILDFDFFDKIIFGMECETIYDLKKISNIKTIEFSPYSKIIKKYQEQIDLFPLKLDNLIIYLDLIKIVNINLPQGLKKLTFYPSNKNIDILDNYCEEIELDNEKSNSILFICNESICWDNLDLNPEIIIIANKNFDITNLANTTKKLYLYLNPLNFDFLPESLEYLSYVNIQENCLMNIPVGIKKIKFILPGKKKINLNLLPDSIEIVELFVINKIIIYLTLIEKLPKNLKKIMFYGNPETDVCTIGCDYTKRKQLIDVQGDKFSFWTELSKYLKEVKEELKVDFEILEI